MLKYLFKADTLYATFAVFVVLGLLALIPLNLHILDPFKMAVRDFNFNDLAWAEMGKGSETETDERIVIINIGDAGREEIALMLEKTLAAAPAAVGLDVLFEEARDSTADNLLRSVIAGKKNLVLGSRLTGHHEVEEAVKNYFDNGKIKTGFVNFVGEEEGVVRHFKPEIQLKGSRYTAFAASVVKVADEEKFKQLEERGNEVEVINYARTTNKYTVIDGDSLLVNEAPVTELKDKIVLLGYVSPMRNDITDKHYTPMNTAGGGKGVPDMNGVIIHANIISMVLDGNYINKTPVWLNWLVAFVLCWLHMAFFIHYYIEKHIWFHLAAKGAQLVLAILFVYLGLLLFTQFNLQINMVPTLAVVLLAVDVLYFYEAFVVWMHRKKWYKTIFYHENHH